MIRNLIYAGVLVVFILTATRSYAAPAYFEGKTKVLEDGLQKVGRDMQFQKEWESLVLEGNTWEKMFTGEEVFRACKSIPTGGMKFSLLTSVWPMMRQNRMSANSGGPRMPGAGLRLAV